MTFGDLLTGFFLNSGNDGANAVAVIVAGSVDNFVELMNRRAAEIGCVDTHFANAHGLTAENHYTTAYDMRSSRARRCRTRHSAASRACRATRSASTSAAI